MAENKGPESMANGLKKGYTKMANTILEDIMGNDFSKREYKILLYVFRHGYGYHQEQSACELNVNQIAQYTGLDRSHVWKTIHLLESKRVLMREEDEIQFNRHANEWRMAKTATKKVRPKQPQHMAKTATDCGQNGHRKDVKAVTVSDIQVPKESLKKKETPVSPENGDCLPPNSTKATEQIIAFLNEATGKRFKPKNTATQRLIRARLSDGFTVEDFNKVIVVKSEQWKGNTEMERYLRPQTLFSNKFEGYLQESNTNTSTQSAYGFGDGDTGIRGYGL